MDSDKHSSVLRRMTTDARVPLRSLSVVGLLRLACEQAAEQALALPLEVQESTDQLRAFEVLIDHMPKDALFAVLEGSVPGFLAIDLPVMGAIVEHQTIGRILPQTATDRTPTRVDAALIAPFVDAILSRFTQALQAEGAAPWGQGVAYGAMVSGRREMLLALPVRDYHVFRFSLSIGGGQRSGHVVFGFGDPPREPEIDEAVPEDQDEAQSLRAGAMMAPVQLDAVVARLSIPLQQLQNLQPEATLPIPSDALGQAQLESGGPDHAIPVTLGQLNGFRAVRLRRAAGRAPEQAIPETAQTDPQHGEAKAATVRDTAGPTADIADTPIAPSKGPEGDVVGPDDLDALLEVAEAGDMLTPV